MCVCGSQGAGAVTMSVCTLLILLLMALPAASGYHVRPVARLLTESNFDRVMMKAIKSKNHRTLFVRFFLHGEGDETHTSWEHVVRTPHQIHGATFGDVNCAESHELMRRFKAGSEGWPMIRYFNGHTGPEGGVYHPPQHVTDTDMRNFIIDTVIDAHKVTKKKHREYLEDLHQQGKGPKPSMEL